MDVIARDPRGPHQYNQEGLVEEAGHSPGRVKATFAKLTPHSRKHYQTGWWLITGESGASFEPARSGMYYWMTPTITDRWKQIRDL